MPMPGRRTKGQVKGEDVQEGGREIGKGVGAGQQSCVTLFNFDMCLRLASYICMPHWSVPVCVVCVGMCVCVVCVNCQFKFKLICQ